MIDLKTMVAEMQEREIPPVVMSHLAAALDKVVIVGESDPLACHPPVYPTYACDFRADGEDGMCSPCRIWFAWKNEEYND